MRNSVLFFTFVREDSEETGVLKKIYAQCKALFLLGNEVHLAIPDKENLNIYRISNEKKEIIEKIKITEYNCLNIINKILRYRKIFNIIGDKIKKNNYNYVYIRRFRFYDAQYMGILFLRNIYKRTVVVFEYPSFPFDKETRDGRGLLIYIIEKIYSYFAFLYIDLIVGVTAGIVRKDASMNKIIMISNGIDVSKIKMRCRDKQKKGITLLGLGILTDYHGYDKIINGLAEYKRTVMCEAINFIVVGEGPEKNKLVDLVKRNKLEDIVIFTGIKKGVELDEIVDICDMAVGSLALYRRGIEIASPLKLREYCARGIPFIYGHEDPDFDETLPYWLRIQVDESPLNMSKILEYARECKENRGVYAIKMREYAEKHLEWTNKMEIINERAIGLKKETRSVNDISKRYVKGDAEKK